LPGEYLASAAVDCPVSSGFHVFMGEHQMKKLTLCIDNLQVESFPTLELVGRASGTVHARQGAAQAVVLGFAGTDASNCASCDTCKGSNCCGCANSTAA
jgi:hypothetical protein